MNKEKINNVYTINDVYTENNCWTKHSEKMSVDVKKWQKKWKKRS
jgi:hypothetical protein